MICKLCPHECAALRTPTLAGGMCNLTTELKVARIAPHMWEEPCISGTNGSGTLFFSGCTLKCVYCQNHEISHSGNGIPITAKELSEQYKRLEQLGVHNINLVSPTQYLPQILKSFEIYKPNIPILYNSSGYERIETLKALNGIIDIYLPDFKYSDKNLSALYSGAPDYPIIAADAISEMLRQTGKLKTDNHGIAVKGVIIRHLVLPNHTKNSIGVLNIIKERFGDNATVSLMGQYIPFGKANEYEKLNRKITKREYQKVLEHLMFLELDGYSQELTAASESYIPQWDFEKPKFL